MSANMHDFHSDGFMFTDSDDVHTTPKTDATHTSFKTSLGLILYWPLLETFF